jgi:hypothetical protein
MWPPESMYSEKWRENLAAISEPPAKMLQWRVVVIIENPSAAAPCLKSSTYVFQLKSHETLDDAQEEFKSLGFTLPDKAKVRYEESK